MCSRFLGAVSNQTGLSVLISLHADVSGYWVPQGGMATGVTAVALLHTLKRLQLT